VRVLMRAVAVLAANGRDAGQTADVNASVRPSNPTQELLTPVLTASPDHGTRNALDSRRVSVNALFEAEQ
jgi:hypothetical protein